MATEVQNLAAFVERARFDDLSEETVEQLEIRILDSIGVAIGALGAEPIRKIRAQLEDFGGRLLATLIGGGRTAPDRAAFYNGALVRYLDFMDSYLARGETCHPSDNLSSVFAACEYAGASGKDFLVALAVAYQVHARLSDEAPVRAKGFDHTTQGAYAVAAGVSKGLGLSVAQIANAIAISGTSNNALRVTRTGALSHWKGLAYPHTAFAGTHAAFLAMRGITGPPEVFEGNKGFKESIAGPFEIDWASEGLDRVQRTIVKKYDAEVHSQSALEVAIDLRSEHGFVGSDVESVEIETFQVAYDIIGGGEEGDKMRVRTKEEADHSLPYMVAVALLDGCVTPAQYSPARIARDDVQSLLRRVRVRATENLSRRFPDELPCRIAIRLRDGSELTAERSDYEGFFSRPMSWARVEEKFHALAAPHADAGLRARIIATVRDLRGASVSDVAELLARVKGPS